LVAFASSSVHHEVILVLLVHGRLSLVDHEEVLGVLAGLHWCGSIVDVQVGCHGLVRYL